MSERVPSFVCYFVRVLSGVFTKPFIVCSDVMVQYNGKVQWYSTMVQYNVKVQRYSTMVQYNGKAQRYSTTVKYNGTVQR